MGRLLELAEHYYAVAADMRAKGNWWLSVAQHLEEAADQMCEQNISETAASETVEDAK